MLCASCGKHLEPVFPGERRRHNDHQNYYDALVIKMEGGYGMYFDEEPVEIIICHSCAIEFLSKNAFLEQALM